MKRGKGDNFFTLVMSLIIIVVILFGRSDHSYSRENGREDYDDSGYEVYTEEEVEQMKRDAYNAGLQASANIQYDADNEYEEEYDAYAQPNQYAHTTVWFTKSGECFHIDRNCYHIRNRDVFSDEMSEVIGYLRPCKDCSYEVIDYYN